MTTVERKRKACGSAVLLAFTATLCGGCLVTDGYQEGKSFPPMTTKVNVWNVLLLVGMGVHALSGPEGASEDPAVSGTCESIFSPAATGR